MAMATATDDERYGWCYNYITTICCALYGNRHRANPFPVGDVAKKQKILVGLGEEMTEIAERLGKEVASRNAKLLDAWRREFDL